MTPKEYELFFYMVKNHIYSIKKQADIVLLSLYPQKSHVKSIIRFILLMETELVKIKYIYYPTMLISMIRKRKPSPLSRQTGVISGD